jgi:uncharacterized repeat protein (TIGR03803 family)
MPHKRFTTAPAKALTTAALALILVSGALAAPKYQVLHAFSGGNDGGGLWSSLLLDKHGNVYGTTISGGQKGKGGTAFKLSRRANGTWSQTVLYSFCSVSNCTDGGGSFAGLIFDTAGNLYGTTVGGGTHDSGVAFELTPSSQGWTEAVLYNFCSLPGCKDGGSPMAGLIRDKAGNLYGTGYVAFELSPDSGAWKLTILHEFPNHNGDGSDPYAVVMDTAGNLYGGTEHGGGGGCDAGCGTAYQLKPMADGKWKENILHEFYTHSGDGAFPGGALFLDGAGNLYGTTDVGGATGDGTVYKLTPRPDGRWNEIILHDFTGGANGDGPSGGVVMDKVGNLYGTTIAGGDPNCECGVVYKLTPQTGGKWNYTVLHRFTGYDGAQPAANVILDSKGNLYGTTITGGAGGAGVAFELTP